MEEKLVIQNFGAIKSVEVALRKVTVFIGDQATGKSTIAKVLCICRYFSYITNTGVFSSHFNVGLREWGIRDYFNEKSYLFYENDDYSFEVKGAQELEKETINLIPKTERFKNLLEELQRLKKEIPENVSSLLWSPNESFFITNVKRVMNNPFYFPTERGLQSIFSLGRHSISTMSDALYNQFALLDRITKNFNSEIKIEPLSILYKNENGQGLIKKENENTFYSLKSGASGYQSTIPLVLAIKYYNEIEKRPRTFVIEEPEQNLFPKTQKQLVEFLVKTVNEQGNQFLFPTHSPYILTTLANLVYAHKIGKIDEKSVNKIIPKASWINIDDVSVYYLKDGIAVDMVDTNECLINLDELDNVSEIINKEFDELLSIEINSISNA